MIPVLMIYNSGLSCQFINLAVLECDISVFIHGIVLIVTVQTLKPLKRAHSTFSKPKGNDILVQKRSMELG